MHRYSRPLLIVALGLLAILTVGAFVPGDILHLATGRKDGLLHGIGVGLVTFLMVLALPRWWLAWAGIVVVATGMVELVQPIVGRGAQWSDFLAGGAGLLAGAAAAAAALAAVRAGRRGRR